MKSGLEATLIRRVSSKKSLITQSAAQATVVSPEFRFGLAATSSRRTDVRDVGSEWRKEEVEEDGWEGGEGPRKVGEPSIVATAATAASCVRTYE